MALLVAVMLAGGYLNLALAVAIPTIPKYYRVIRSITLSVREKTFIEAERALGAGRLYIVFHHILPRCLPSLIVLITLGLADAAMTVAALGFLGYGVQPPTPEWGTDISFGARVMTQGAWWLSIFPSLMIALAVLGFNLLGEGINDTLKLQLSRL
jgi:peptide/nickel transport system permease protein